MKNGRNDIPISFYFIGGILVIWFSLLIAPYINEGLISIVNNFSYAINKPFNIKWCDNSLKTIFIFIALYIMGVGIYISTRKNYRR